MPIPERMLIYSESSRNDNKFRSKEEDFTTPKMTTLLDHIRRNCQVKGYTSNEPSSKSST